MGEVVRRAPDSKGVTEPSRFRRIRRLGQGGMGVVYEVEDTVRHRRLALKTIRDDNPERLYQLKLEFRRVARLVHRNLVRLDELAADDEGVFFTMELVEGTGILDHCSPPFGSGLRFDERKLRAAYDELSQGLAYLHGNGLVHRDVKPSNVLVESSTDRVVLVDFGLVADANNDNFATFTSHTAGTAAYMAPEQSESSAGFGPTADWYAFGVMLFENLSGRLPFVGSTVDILQQKKSCNPPDVREFAPDAPDDLATLCMALVNRDPRQRPGPELIGKVLSAERSSAAAVAPPQWPRTRFAARTEELAVLDDALRQVRSGARRVVLLRGPSGIGKSALIDEFLQRAAQGDRNAVVLAGRCYHRESVPYKAMDALIDQLSAYWRRLPHAEAMYLLPREPEFLVRAFPILRRVREVSDAAAQERPVSPQEALNRALFALRETLQRLGRRTTLVLSLDDMQWVDADSVRLLRYLLESEDPPAMLMVLGCRPLDSVDESFDALLEPILRDAHLIELGPLSDIEMRQLVLQVVGDDENCIVDGVTREAHGIPLFGLILARHFGPHDREADLDLDAVLREQVSALSPLGRTLVELTTVAQSPLTPELSARASSTPLGQVLEELHRLETLHVIRVTGGAAVGRFETYHDRIGESIQQRLPSERRRVLHLGLALAYQAEERVDFDACARNFEGAGDVERAAQHARCAAEEAEHRLAFARAAQHYRLCLRVPGLSSGESGAIHKLLADALSNSGCGGDAAEHYLIACKYLSGDERLQCEQRAAEEFLRAGYLERGLTTLRSVVDDAGLPYPTSALVALGAGVIRRSIGRWQRIPEEVRGPSDIEPGLLRQLDTCSSVAHCLGFLNPRMTNFYQGLHLQLAYRAREPTRLCRALAAEAIYDAMGGRLSPRTENALQRARELARDDAKAVGIVTYTEGVVAFMVGQWGQAFACCARGEEILRSGCSGVQWQLDTTMLWLLAALHAMGRISELRQRRVQHLEEAEGRHDLYALTILRSGSAHAVRLAQDQPKLLKEEVASVMSMWPDDHFSVPRYWELVALTNADLYAGHDAEALSRFDTWESRIARSIPLRVQVTRVRARHARARAALAVAEEQRDNRDLLGLVLGDAAKLEGERAPWVGALAASLRAGAAAVKRDRSRCVEWLMAAEAQFFASDMSLDAYAVRRRRGQVVGGTDGALIVSESDAWMANRGIQNPSAIARVHAPGFAAY